MTFYTSSDNGDVTMPLLSDEPSMDYPPPSSPTSPIASEGHIILSHPSDEFHSAAPAHPPSTSSITPAVDLPCSSDLSVPPPPSYQEAWNYNIFDPMSKNPPRPLPGPPTLGSRLDDFIDRLHRLPPITFNDINETMTRTYTGDWSFTGPLAPVLIPLFVVFVEFPLSMALFGYVLATALVSSVLLILMPFIGAPLYSGFALSWRALARVELVLHRELLGLTHHCPEARRPHPIIPRLTSASPGTSTSFPWRHMRQIMLDRGTTFSLILLILVKPALALVNFLYVMCVMLPLFVTGIIFCIPAGIHGPVLSLLQGYAGFMARRLCEFDEDTQEVVEVEERDVEVLAEVEDLERAPVGRLVDIEVHDGEEEELRRG